MAPGRTERGFREAPELGDAVRRMLRSLAKRAAAGDLFALEELARLDADLETYTRDAVQGAHYGEPAYSWGELSRELGISRQAVQQRFGRREAD